MSKREEFIAAINIIKAASQTITPELHKGLLQQAVQEYELTINEATDIINRSGLVVGEKVNYFQVLGLTIAEIEDQNEDTIAKCVDAANNERYTASLRAGGLPRKDGRTQEQRRTLLTPPGMVLIPEGNFQMGSNGENADESEKPVHTVYVDAFYMDKHLVTNAQFLTFINANPQWANHQIGSA